MLNKKICQKCWIKSVEIDNENCYWNINDELEWTKWKRVWCPKVNNDININEVPECCSYLLEQTLWD